MPELSVIGLQHQRTRQDREDEHGKIFSDFRLGNGSGTCGNPVCSGRVVGDNEFGEPGVGEGLGLLIKKSLPTQERRGKEDLERP